MKRFGFIFFLCVCVVTIQAHSQETPPQIVDFSDSYVRSSGSGAALFGGRMQRRMAGNVESIYLRQRGDIKRDAFGAESTPVPVPISESYHTGDLFYDGVLYVGVRMRLDIYRDELVVLPPGDSWYGAVLEPKRLGWADLCGYRVIFVREGDIPGGYYLQLFDGDNELLKKDKIEFDATWVEFRSYVHKYYVKRDGTYRSVSRSKGSVLRLFSDRRGDMARFIRAKRLNFKKDTDRSLEAVVNEYERLTHK